jgi:hydrogenase/urease accessory protein HupE
VRALARLLGRAFALANPSARARRIGGVRALVKVIACTVVLAAPALAFAHDARPLYVGIVEQSAGLYRVVVRAPPALDAANAPSIVWPSVCSVRETSPLRLDLGDASLIVCRGGLEGQTLRIAYPLYNPSITTLVRVTAASGAVDTAVLPPDVLEWTVPRSPSFLAVARDYLVLGFRHIWTGPDHLLFVAGLMLLARRPRRILIAVTGFTLAHSITLSLATLGVVRVPIAPVEALIALSVLFLAGEVARRGSDDFSHRYPVVLSFVFGLLHGFGFASALAEIGLPRNELAIGLLFFNLGVEVGQIAFIAAVAAVFFGWTRLLRWFDPARTTGIGAGAARLAPYALGIPAAFWFVERTVAALAGS